MTVSINYGLNAPVFRTLYFPSGINNLVLGMTVSLTSQTYTVIESGFSVTVSAVLSSDSEGALERDLVVTMETTDGTATLSTLYV